MMWIPEGFAHGFITLEDDTIFQYKCTNYYNRESECGIIWNDPDLKIDWGIDKPMVSDKDLQGNRYNDLVSPF
jgi:dTDP-4-dehydrorhamnose 3,5-epimerase